MNIQPSTTRFVVPSSITVGPHPPIAPIPPIPPLERDVATKANEEHEARLVEISQTVSREGLAALTNGFQSQAAQSLARTQQLIGHYYQGLADGTRALRKQLQVRGLRAPEDALDFILGISEDAPTAHQGLQAAARQAKQDGDEIEHQFLKRQLQLLRKRYAKPAPNQVLSIRANQLRTQRRSKLSPTERFYSAATDGALNLGGLVDALLSGLREDGEFKAALSEARSSMAGHVSHASSFHGMQRARPLMNGLTTTLHVATLLGECERLLAHMRNHNHKVDVEPIAVLRHLLTLRDMHMDPIQTRALVELIGGPGLRNQLACLNQLSRIVCYCIPIELWRAKKDFSTVKDNLRALSTLLTDEEQQLAQEKNALCSL